MPRRKVEKEEEPPFLVSYHVRIRDKDLHRRIAYAAAINDVRITSLFEAWILERAKTLPPVKL